jgi:hypothetical protein
MNGSMGERVGKLEANRSLGKPSRRWKGVDKIYLAQGPQAEFCEHTLMLAVYLQA